MSLDTTKIGQVAAELMEAVEEHYGPEAEIADAMIIVEVDVGDEEFTEVRCSSDRAVVKRGLIHYGVDCVLDGEGPDE